MKTAFYKFSQNNSWGTFDVADDSIDCSCCGDRWFRADRDSIVKLEGQTIEEYVKEEVEIPYPFFKFTSPYIRIFYLNGKITEL